MSTIWDAALEEVKIKREHEAYKGISTDKYVLFIGGKSSGKTTALLRFLNRDEPTKPSVALEYTYARKSQMHGNTIGHIWELGGGTFLAKLLEISLNVDTLKQMTVVLDSRTIEPFPVPLIIIGSKYDLFQDMEPEQRKVITKTVRFLSHVNGATLVFLSSKIESTVKALRHVMNHATFDAELSSKSTIDPQKPLYIPAGMDSFEGIGNPTVASSDIGRLSSRNPMDMWRMAFCGHFPQEGEDKKGLLTKAEDPAKDVQFAEPLVDEARSQKDRELEAYRRQEKNKWTKMLQIVRW